MGYPKVIDISYCQPEASISWDRLRELGVAVIMRMGQGIWEDTLFQSDYNNALKAGTLFGVYWFFQPNMQAEFQVQAFLKIYNALPVKPTAIFLDVEDIDYKDDAGNWQKVYPLNVPWHTAQLKIWLARIEAETGHIPGVYTRKNYWDAWTERSAEWKHYHLWVACWTNYSENILLPADWDAWLIWQYVGGSNWQDGVSVHVDGDYFNGSQSEMDKFFGGTGGTSSMKTISQILGGTLTPDQCSWWMRFSGDMKLASGKTWPGDVWVDGLIMDAYRMDLKAADNAVLELPTSDFAARAALMHALKNAEGEGVPIRASAEAVIDAGYFPMKQFSFPTVANWLLYDDIMIRSFLKGIASNTFGSAWTFDPEGLKRIKLAPFELVHIRMEQFHHYPYSTWPDPNWRDKDTPEARLAARIGTNPLPGNWQAMVLAKFLDHLNLLQVAGVIPATVQFVFETDIDWFNYYQKEVGAELNKRPWVTMHVIDPQLTSTGTFDNLYPIYESLKVIQGKWTPNIVFPDGVRASFWGFTQGKQKSVLFGDTPLELSFFAGTPAAMVAAIPLVTGGEVVPPGGGDDGGGDDNPPTEIETAIAELKAEIVSLKAKNVSLEGRVTALEGWKNTPLA